ncbi:MAG TPA: hypothetical protein GXX15_01685 [Clostridia bacterium]|nr:hypothetical protein [Clostridia bacterium]
MVTLTASHIAYLIMILIILILLLMRKDIILPIILAIFLIGFLSTGNILKAVQILYTAIFVSGKRLWQIIVIISLIISMSKALDDIGADIIITKPFIKYLKTPIFSFWIIGFLMMFLSFFIWPAPAVGLIGTVLINPALKSGIDKVSLASIVSIFGFGAALSGDFFIQGAPSITARATGIPIHTLILASLPIWATASAVSILILYFITLQQSKRQQQNNHLDVNSIDKPSPPFSSVVVSIIAVGLFILDIILMLLFKIHSNAATALIGGTSIIVLIASTLVQKNFLDKTREYLREGFITGMRTFAPIIVISAFFLLGETSMVKEVISPHAKGYLVDLGMYLSQHIPLNKYTVSLLEFSLGVLTGLSGSGFSGLPLIGAIAKTFSSTLNLNPAILASIGQIAAIWTGGGTIIPWSTVAVSTVIDVEAEKISKKNMVPAIAGLIAAYLVTIFLL